MRIDQRLVVAAERSESRSIYRDVRIFEGQAERAASTEDSAVVLAEPLAIQALLDQIYRNGGYNTIEYSAPALPPLEGADAEWA